MFLTLFITIYLCSTFCLERKREEKRREGGGVFLAVNSFLIAQECVQLSNCELRRKGWEKLVPCCWKLCWHLSSSFFPNKKFLLLCFKCQDFFSQAPKSINQSIIPSYKLHKTSFCFSMAFSVLLPLPSYGFCYDFTTR